MRHLARFVPVLALGLGLGLSLACGGGSDTPSSAATASPLATGLSYTDPTTTGWRLVKDETSTPTRLVLNLMGPSGLKTRGAGFNLQGPATVHFGTFSETAMPVRAGHVYELLNIDPRDPWTGEPIPNDPQEPLLLAGGVKPGNLLTAGIFQKDRRATAKDSGAVLLQIALEFDPTAKLGQGDALPLAITKSKYMAEDIGSFSINPTTEMRQKAHLVDMTIALGTLRAN